MKKWIIGIIVFLALIMGIVVGYFNISANESVDISEDLLSYQEKLELKFSSYGYTIDNPNVILNPYEISPLTALVMFETDSYVTPTVTIVGKDERSSIVNTFDEAKEHCLPIYGLYPDTNNQVIISYGEVSKSIYIKTDKLPDDFILPNYVFNSDKLSNEMYFYTPSSIGYTCAYDVNGDVRWYLTDYFIWEVNRLSNGNLMLSTNRLVNSPYYMTGLVEIDLLGKIYFEYTIPGGYHHDYFEMPDGNIMIASDNFGNGMVEDYIVVLDRKNGKIIKSIDLTEILPMEEGKSENWVNYDWFHNNSVWYDENTNSVTLSGRHLDMVVNLDYDTLNINYIIGDSTGYSDEYKEYFLTPISNDFEWQWSQHAAMILPNGDVFIFDNGNNKSKDKDKYVSATDSYSRGVIYHVDKDDMTISQVWQYGKERGSEFYSPYISDVDYLGKNHYIIHSGGISSKDGVALNVPAGLGKADSLNSITVEILNDEIIFELSLPTNNYRVEKLNLYSNGTFKLGKAVRLGQMEVTTLSLSNTLLLNTSELDKEYNNHKIRLTKEMDRLVFSGVFKKDENVKIILDKFMGKKEYDVTISKKPYTAMCVDIFTEKEEVDGISVTKYINSNGLHGRYSIYIKINDKVYKTNKYVDF